MIDHRYMIVSGFHSEPGRGLEWFHHLWWHNLMKHARPAPQRVLIIADSNCSVSGGNGDWIIFSGDLGHGGDLLKGRKHNYLPGCPAVWMAGAMLAYINECDFIYLEQDCLAFGPWVERLYSEVTPGRFVCYGRTGSHPASTCLFLVRHSYIPLFVRDYIDEGQEDRPERIAEHKFARLAERSPEYYRQFSFRTDNDRPIYPQDAVFACQKLTPDELRLLERHGLVSTIEMPANVKMFSNELPPDL